MLAWLFSIEGLAAFITCFATLMIFSFLYKDNPYYKFAEHVFVGVSTGYGIVLVWFQILRPNLVDRLIPPVDVVKLTLFRQGLLGPEDYASYQVGLGERLVQGQWVYYIFLLLGILMLFKISRKLHWLSRWPLAYVIGAFAGIQIIQAAQGSLVPQLEATMKDFSGQETVVAELTASGLLPEQEMETRRSNQVAWLSKWLGAVALQDAALRAAQAWQAELETRLEGLADPQELETRPREAFKSMRVRQAEIVQQESEFEELLCRELGGRPLGDALLLASSGRGDFVALPPAMNAGARDSLWAADPLAPADLAFLNLKPWQDALALAATRIWLESAIGRSILEAELAPSLGRMAPVILENLIHPVGQAGLTQIFKAEAFPDSAQPDWSLPMTNRLADSLLSEFNPRGARISDWQGGQVADLRTRLEVPSGSATLLATDLNMRLAAFEGLADSDRVEAGTSFLALWRRGLERELRDLRQVWLLHTIGQYTSPDLSSAFSREQVRQFRQDPAAMLAPAGVATSTSTIRVRMLVELLSNLLVVVGVCAGIFYFFFSKKHTGALGMVSKVGIAFLMMSFGASFGYTVMGRISLAIGRFQDLLAWPWMAGTALVVLVVALALESRRKPA